MTTREQLEAEAAELYPTPADPYTPHEAFQERAAYVRAKTVSAEQVEAAMDGYREGWDAEYNGRRLHQSAIEAALRAAGLHVEEEA